MEYYENAGDAVARLSWLSLNPPQPGCPTVPPDCTQTTVPSGSWKAEYFSGKFGCKLMVSNEGTNDINWDWGSGGPNTCGVGSDNFSVRWTRTVHFEAGTYQFTATADDGVRVWIDKSTGTSPIIDAWYDQGATAHTGNYTFAAAGDHAITMEYYENAGDAVARLSWQLLPSQCPTSNIPLDRWKGEYFNNMNLDGCPALVRDDTRVQDNFISFDWGGGSPHASIGVDHFSARWTRRVSFPASGDYEFTVVGDDGVRLFIDGVHQNLSGWKDQAPTEDKKTVNLLAGVHDIRLDYYENGGGALAQLSWQFKNPPVNPSIEPRVGSVNFPTVLYSYTDTSASSTYSAATSVSDLKELRILIASHLAVEPNEFQPMVRRDPDGYLRAYLHAEQVGYNFYGEGNVLGGTGVLIGVGVPRHDSKVISNQWSQFNVGESYVELSADQKTITVHWSFQVKYAIGNQILFSCVVDKDGGVDTVSAGHVDFGYHNMGSLETRNPTACAVGVPSGNWRADYYNNLELTPPIMMTVDDGNPDFVNHNWFNGSPGSSCGLGATNFSVRWTRTKNF
ncbi:MAG: PA14 domain-containing protein, partial [Deltaproteobacteria bacterium]|nr:PA14 domain-containing protein [Deltaproteobacteria bacterium]